MRKLRLYKEQKHYAVLNENKACPIVQPWALEDFPEVCELTIDNVLHHLTSMEADLAMLNWFDCLPVQSHIKIVVPDADYFMKMWLDADWTNSTLLSSSSSARCAFSGLFGLQEDGNPRDLCYDFAQPGVFKSAYNAQRLEVLLERAGFCHLNVTSSDVGILAMQGKKTMQRGERQIAKTLSDVRMDHINRYKFAAEYLADLAPSSILDCACGIGYGSNMLAKELDAKVLGVDIDEGAIEHANLYYKSDLNQYCLADAKIHDFGKSKFDAIISFETIEHIDFDSLLLEKFCQALEPGGKLICSTPNQDVMPFDKNKFPFHVKHYTNSEIINLLENAGFNNMEIYSQQGHKEGEVELGIGGHFTVFVASKA